MEPCEQESEVKWRSLIWLLYGTQEGGLWDGLMEARPWWPG